MIFVNGIAVVWCLFTAGTRSQSPYNTSCRETFGTLVAITGITLVQFTHFTMAILLGSRDAG
jgi:hypothetical protein